LGRNVPSKLGRQTLVSFRTSPNYSFCTTWQNGKHGHHIFSLKCRMLLYKKTKTHGITLRGIASSRLLDTRSAFTASDVISVAVLNMKVSRLFFFKLERKSMYSITAISYYLKMLTSIRHVVGANYILRDRRLREMYTVCLSPHSHTIARTRM